MIEKRSGCPINLAVEVIGDRWNLIVIRDIMFGNRRHFRELLTNSEEGIASNILAARLKRLVAEGLLKRMFAASLPVPSMYQVIRTLRGAGFPTALLSNSWGCDEYPRADFPGLFDTVVISGEVGMRKPEPEIFVHAAATLGLEPAECVFIDDVKANIAAAVACGMAGVHHTDPAVTAGELETLLGVGLKVRK